MHSVKCLVVDRLPRNARDHAGSVSLATAESTLKAFLFCVDSAWQLLFSARFDHDYKHSTNCGKISTDEAISVR